MGRRRKTTPKSSAHSIRRYQIAGLAIVLVLFAGVGGWAAYASISGAVIASGVISVESRSKRVQHLDGGIVAAIHVDDGDRVTAGDLLVRLDDTETRANLAIVTRRLAELETRRVRLRGERDKVDRLSLPAPLRGAFETIDLAEMLASQQRLFEARRETIRGRIRQIDQRIEQYGEQVRGLKAQIQAKDKQLRYVGQQLESLMKLREKNLVRMPRIRQLQGRLANLEGERGKLISDTATTRIRASEAAEKKLEIAANARSRVLQELREVEAQIGELMERRVAAKARLSRIEIRAPKAGIVHAMTAHTIGGVIAPGATVLEIVPVTENLIITARIQSRDVDQIELNQPVRIHMTAYSQRNTPELNGRVSYVSADLARTEEDVPPTYEVKVVFAPGELQRLGDKPLVPGMPVDIFIQTDERTVMSYLMKPLAEQLHRAFKEE